MGNNLYMKNDPMYVFDRNQPMKNTISIQEKGETSLLIKATDDNKVLVNGKSLETKEDIELVLNIIIKCINGFMR